MSGFVQGALVAGGLTLAGVLLTQVTNLLLEKRREEASYRVNLYDRRLAVHQQAFGWLMKLVEPLKKTWDKASESEGRRQLATLCDDADEWWNANCLYLDPWSRDKMLTFIFEARLWANDPSHKPAEGSVAKLYRDAWFAVQKGIGMKHIDMKGLPKEFQE
jgi:hypothetical protein